MGKLNKSKLAKYLFDNYGQFTEETIQSDQAYQILSKALSSGRNKISKTQIKNEIENNARYYAHQLNQGGNQEQETCRTNNQATTSSGYGKKMLIHGQGIYGEDKRGVMQFENNQDLTVTIISSPSVRKHHNIFSPSVFC